MAEASGGDEDVAILGMGKTHRAQGSGFNAVGGQRAEMGRGSDGDKGAAFKGVRGEMHERKEGKAQEGGRGGMS